MYFCEPIDPDPACRSPIYQIKANEMPFVKPGNGIFVLNVGDILREFGIILGKYHTLDRRFMGSQVLDISISCI